MQNNVGSGHSISANTKQPRSNGASGYAPVKDTPVSVKYERVRPIKPDPVKHRASTPKNEKKAAVNSPRRTALRDFLFGFTVGLVIFGTAAAIICNALIKLIS